MVSHDNDYLVIAHSLRQAGGEEPGQEVLGGGGAAHLTHLGGEGAGTVPGQHQGGGQQQQREHGYFVLATQHLCYVHPLICRAACERYKHVKQALTSQGFWDLFLHAQENN